MNLTLEFLNTAAFNIPTGKDPSYIPLLLKQVRFMNFLFSARHAVSTGCPTAIFFSYTLQGKQFSFYEYRRKEESLIYTVLILFSASTLDFCRHFAKCVLQWIGFGIS